MTALRAMTADDVPAVRALDVALFGPSAWSEAMFADEVAAPDRRYLVAVDGEAIVGYGGVLARPEAEIMTLGVAPTHRRRGLGAGLLAALLEAADGAREVFLEVRSDEAAPQALYRRFGFEEIGRRAGYYALEGADAVIMRLRLTRDIGPVGSEVQP